jgi:hypothetical protein
MVIFPDAGLPGPKRGIGISIMVRSGSFSFSEERCQGHREKSRTQQTYRDGNLRKLLGPNDVRGDSSAIVC